MIFFWVLGYGGLYYASEKLSILAGIPHMITVIIMSLFIFSGFIALRSANKSNTWYIKFSFSKKLIVSLPLLLLPIANLIFNPRPFGLGEMHFNIWEALLIVISAISEELLFRSFFIDFFTNKLKIKLLSTSIAAALIFGIFHLVNAFSGAPLDETFLQVLLATAVGFSFTLAVVYNDSIWPCIVIHSLVNLAAYMGNGGAFILNSPWQVFVYLLISIFYMVYGIFLYQIIARSNVKYGALY